MTTLTIIFIVLKVLEVISWSWFWVLSPVILQVSFTLLMWIFSLILTITTWKL